MKYKTCEIPGCDNLTTADKYCHKHNSVIKYKPCIHYYHKKEKLSIPVEWCSKKDKRYIECNCDTCLDWQDTEEYLKGDGKDDK